MRGKKFWGFSPGAKPLALGGASLTSIHGGEWQIVLSSSSHGDDIAVTLGGRSPDRGYWEMKATCLPALPLTTTYPASLHMVQPEGLPRALIHYIELVPIGHTDEVVALLTGSVHQRHHGGCIGQADLLWEGDRVMGSRPQQSLHCSPTECPL